MSRILSHAAVDSPAGGSYNIGITSVKKIIRIGNSAGVILSRAELTRSGLALDAPVTIRSSRGRIEVASVEARVRATVSDRFAEMVDDFVLRYRKVFVQLAKETDR